MQSIVDDFARAAVRYGLTIRIKKTDVLHQPRPGTPLGNPIITIGNEALKLVQKFCYLGGTISQNSKFYDELMARISKASASFRLLQHRLWSKRGMRLNTKIQVYRTVVVSTLLYESETWTTYRDHLKNPERFHMRCLRKICGVRWIDKIPNT